MPRLTAEQLKERANGMGSTDVVEALGIAPWDGAGPMRLYLSKVAGVVEDEGEPEDDLEWGHVQEKVILDWYQRETGAELVPGGQVAAPHEPWLFATLDGAVMGEGRNVEAKNVGLGMSWHWNLSDEDGIPRYVRAQVTIGMYCRGVRECDVVAAVGGRPPQVWRVGYDDKLATLLVSGGKAFWRNVQARIPPPLDHTDATRDYLLKLYPSNADRVTIDADNELDDLGAQRIAHHLAESRAKQEKRRIDAEIMRQIGDHDGVRGSGWSMTWRKDKNGVRKPRFTARGAGADDE